METDHLRNPPTPMRSSHMLECLVGLLAGAAWLLWEYQILSDAEAVTSLFAAVVALWTTLICNVVRARSGPGDR